MGPSPNDLTRTAQLAAPASKSGQVSSWSELSLEFHLCDGTDGNRHTVPSWWPWWIPILRENESPKTSSPEKRTAGPEESLSQQGTRESGSDELENRSIGRVSAETRESLGGADLSIIIRIG